METFNLEKSFEYGTNQVRTILDTNSNIWFVGIDVCNVLGYSDSYQKIKNLDDDEYKLDRIIDGQGKLKDTLTVNEFGLYSLILSSTKPEAKAFKRWITHNVLPSIRKAGKYSTDDMNLREESIQTFITQIEVMENDINELRNKLNDKNKLLRLKQNELKLLLKTDIRQLRLNI